ncbi:MAG: TrkA family potassium uptake protein [Nostocaceae cyanobacterium]|nr:TrkA family potassium uptake protein [Nostocaceae cyanobacterium]
MKVILIGGGKLAYFLAKDFLNKGYQLTIINQDPTEARNLSRQLKATVILGDGTNLQKLQEAGAYQANIVLSVTHHDQDNLVACQIAQKCFGVARTIALVNDPDYQEVFLKLGVTVAFSATQILATLIEQQADFDEIKSLIPIAEGQLNITELILPEDSPAVGQRLADLALPEASLIASIIRQGKVIVPRGWSHLQAADRLILISQPQDYEQVLKILTGEEL